MIWTKENLWTLQIMYSNPEYSVKEISEYFEVSVAAIRNAAGKNLMRRGTYRDQGYKKCSKCKCILPATSKYFHRNKSWRDGLHNHCKECRKDYHKK